MERTLAEQFATTVTPLSFLPKHKVEQYEQFVKGYDPAT